MTDPGRPMLSVVAPCFNEETILPEFMQRVGTVLDKMGTSSEVVLVDDGSRDRTWDLLVGAAAADHRVVAVRLMRRHGHQLALTAGLSICRGERILIIDADLQDPPELLPDMMALIDEGADVVYGQRRQREGESLFKRATATAFYWLIASLSEVPIPIDTGDFRLITRRVLDILLAMPERNRFMRGMFAWIGGQQVPLVYDRKARVAGKTKYQLPTMIRLAVDAITGFSIAPLMIAMSIGWVMAAVGFALFLYSIVGWLLDKNLPGWTSLMAAIGLLGGIQFLMLGIIGSYLGRIHNQVAGRPLFIIRDIVGRAKMSHEDLNTVGNPISRLDEPLEFDE
jgi:glycosyltransferase involved in cell wall biosynthesis